MDEFDWNQARAFLATAEAGSLSAAARRLGLTQPTLGRQVSALEADLGVTLFERVGRNFVLTESGLALLENARAMGHAAEALTLTATGRAQSVEGRVAISASDGMSAYLLPPIIETIRREAPGITVEIVAENTLTDLRRREADIAIRHVRPEQPDLIGRKLAETTGHFYASQAWVERNGLPRKAEEVATADFIGFDASGRFIERLRSMGLPIGPDNFRIVSENSVVAWEMVKGGLGISIMSKNIADRTEGIVQVLRDLPPVPIPIWLVTHRELRTSRRIRVVFDILAEAFSAGANNEGRF